MSVDEIIEGEVIAEEDESVDLGERLENIAKLSVDYEQLFADLENDLTPEAIAGTLMGYKVPSAGLQRSLLRERLMAALRGTVKSPARFVDGWIQESKANGGDDDSLQGSTWTPEPVEPWPHEVELADVLDEVRAIFDAYVYASPTSLDALALWTVFTHVYDAFGIAPLLDLTSPAMRCGKTSTMVIVGSLGKDTLLASNVTPAGIFRVIEQSKPSLMIDEADTFAAMSEELRGILNSGHTRRTAFVIRVEGDAREPRTFSTFGPKAIAAIGSLPPTIEDRSVKIALTRKPTSAVKADAYDEEGVRMACNPARSKIARAADDCLAEIEAVEVERPRGLHDRAWNNWRPLLAIAAVAGEDWYSRAVTAAVTLSSGGDEPDETLLALRHVYETLRDFSYDGRLSTEDVLFHLVARDDGPWAEKWARDLNADRARRDIRGPSAALAKLLKPFGIRPRKLRVEGQAEPVRGYDVEWFEADAVAPFLADAGNAPEDGTDGTDGTHESGSGADVPSVPSVPSPEQDEGGADW